MPAMVLVIVSVMVVAQMVSIVMVIATMSDDRANGFDDIDTGDYI